MSRKLSLRERRASALADAAGWMELLRLDQKGFEILSEKLNLKVDPYYPIPDPVLRLIATLRFLVTGEGYHDDLENMFGETCSMIIHALDKIEWPASKMDWENIADGFQTKWKVENCLGAMISLPLKVDAPPELKWLFETSNGKEEFLYAVVVDADYHIFFKGMTFHAIFEDDHFTKMLEKHSSEYPHPSADRSGRKVPYTFVGSDDFEPSSYLRVLSSAKGEEDKLIIRQGLRPGELAMEMIKNRFGILKTTIPLVSPAGCIRLTVTISVLHNYFLETNPKYSAEYKDVDQLRNNLPPTNQGVKKGSLRVTIPGRTLDEDKPWMDQMHMDKEVFRCLLQLALPHITKRAMGNSPTLSLRVALRYIATGQGYDPMVDGMLSHTLECISLALQNYEKTLPLTEKKWMEIGTAFDKKMSLPNCVGVLCSRLLDQHNPKKSLLVMIVDATGRIFGSRTVLQENQSSTPTELQEVFMQTTTFRLSSAKGFMFIGDTLSKPRPMLATSANPAHFTGEQIERGQKLGEQVIHVLKERFQALNQVNGRKEVSGNSRPVVGVILCRMHNFLMDKSATYGDVFK